MHDKLIGRLRRQITAVLILKHALLWLAAWAFVWGTVVIIWRVITGAPGEELWLGLVGAPICALVAAALAMRKVPTSDRLRAVVDRASGCGGLLMAAAETSLGPWQLSLPDPSKLVVQWRGERAWLTFLAGSAFLLVALLFPQGLVSLAAAPLDISQEAAQLAVQLDVLKQEAVLEPQRAELLRERLKQLKDDASGKSPVKTLEALDHLRDIVSKAAKQAAESALAKGEQLGQAEGLADGIRKNDGALDAKVEKEALAALAEMVEKAAAETDLLDKQLDPELLKQLQAGKLNAEQLGKLAEALKGSKRGLAQMLDKLHSAKLIDAELLKKLAEAGKCDCAGALKELGGKLKIADILARSTGAGAGQGGVNEGPGSAPITWSHETKEDGTKFKEETLPPGALAKLKESMLLGVGRTDPDSKDRAPSRGGALVNANAGGGSASSQLVLPQHRQAVERYFARPNPQDAKK